MPLSDNEQFGSSGLRSVAISPDGSHIVYATSHRLFARSMSDAVVAPIRGTDSDGDVGAAAFSPDGESIVVFAATERNSTAATADLRRLLPRGAIRRIPLRGGTPTTLCEADFPFGISWSREGIVFGQLGKGVMRVSATGGEPELLASVKDGEVPLDPQMLPGGETILFTEVNGVGLRLRLEDDPSRTAVLWDKGRIVVQTLKTGERRTVIGGGSAARYVGTGHIVFALAGTLRGVPFDVRRLALSGDAVPVVEGVARTRYAALPTDSAHFRVSETGTLVYLPGPVVVAESPPRDIGMFGREGTTQPLKLPPMAYEFPRLSPDGQQLAVSTDNGRAAQIWICDLLGSGPPRQLTFQGRNRYPIWSPDGRRVTFQSDADGDLSIFWQAADGRSSAGTSHESRSACDTRSAGVVSERRDAHVQCRVPVRVFPVDTRGSRSHNRPVRYCTVANDPAGGCVFVRWSMGRVSGNSGSADFREAISSHREASRDQAN
jgi:eukaryotic-like serine/threonine-protein kinase